MFSWFYENLRSSVDWHVMILFFGMPLGYLYESLGTGRSVLLRILQLVLELFSHIRKDL